MGKFKPGDRVSHDFSKELGYIRIVDENRPKYKYFVMWDDEPNRSDWYEEKVLVPSKPEKES